MNPLEDPRVVVDEYLVKPTHFDDLPEYEKMHFCVVVTNGHAYGWSVRRGQSNSSFAMNRKGKWIIESRGSGHNKARRWPLEEALTIALKHVDSVKINGRTAQEWVEFWDREEK